jgi:hypothetical protein
MLNKVRQGMSRYFAGKRLQKIGAALLETLAIQTKLSWINPENADELVKQALSMQRIVNQVRILNNKPWKETHSIFQNQK